MALGGAAIAMPLVADRRRAHASPMAWQRFQQPLRIPPVLEPTRRTDAQDEYDVLQREAEQEIWPGLATGIWGYNGQFPGPTIRVRRNRTTVVRHTNRLSSPTIVHLHGGVTPTDSDGFPADVMAPGESRTFTYPNRQHASTLWYHDHTMDRTGEHIFRGLAGFYLIEDDEEGALPLPKGPYDVPLLVQDRAFNADGSFHYDTHRHFGFQGDVMLVNGVPWPRMDVATRKYRFRLLNGSNARPLQLALSNRDPLTLIATDGGLLPAPVMVRSLPLAMAERAEVVVDFTAYAPGTKIFLLNQRAGPRLAQVMRFDVVSREPDDATIPARLGGPGFLDRPASAPITTWSFRASLNLREGLPPIRWSINGQPFDPARSDAQIPLDTTQVWRFRNETPVPFFGRPHPAHVHLAHFRILERNGNPPLAHERGLKDTVALDGGDDVLVLIRFEQFRGRHLVHCHNLEHEDHSMMSRFDVV